ncbi:hypothetical protein BKA63DRAFT_510636 [Paraphoma chrysanthemicola]|nr:hypothetical protein BKA63DRAFT_510636 [Paraphoma chrysanthemicola]
MIAALRFTLASIAKLSNGQPHLQGIICSSWRLKHLGLGNDSVALHIQRVVREDQISASSAATVRCSKIERS